LTFLSWRSANQHLPPRHPSLAGTPVVVANEPLTLFTGYGNQFSGIASSLSIPRPRHRSCFHCTAMEQVRPRPAAAPARRRSIFTEVGLIDAHTISKERSPAPILITEHALRQVRPLRTVRFRSRNSVFGKDGIHEVDDESDWESADDDDDGTRPTSTSTSASTFSITHTLSNSRLYRAGLFAIVLALMLPIVQMISVTPLGVYGGAIPRASITAAAERSSLVERADSETDVCKRWSGQSAIVNGTLYMYGFRTTTDAQQDTDTWSKLVLLLPKTHTDDA